MKKIKFENLIAAGALVGILLLFVSFMVEGATIIPVLAILVGIVVASVLSRYIQRVIPLRSITAFLLCLAMACNFVVPAYASSVGIGLLSPYDENNTNTTRLNYLHNMLDLIVQTYGLNSEMSDDDLANMFLTLESEAAYVVWENGNTLVADAKELSTEELEILKAELNAQVCLRFYNIVLQIVNSAPSLAAIESGSVKSPLTASSTDNGGQWKLSETQISVQVAPVAGSCDTYSKQSSTLTLSASEEVEVSFSVTKGSNGTVTITGNGETISDSLFDFTFTGSNELTIKVESGDAKDSNGELTLSYTIKGGDVTILFKAVTGIPYKVNDTSAVDGQDLSLSGGSEGFAVTAVNSAYYPLIGATVESESGTTSIPVMDGKLFPTTSGTLTPIFGYDEDADGEAPFKVGTASYWDWDSAILAAGSNGTVVVNDDYTVNGNYTIPSDVTLLVPRDASDTGSWAKIESSGAASVYRTLTIAEGASLTVHGNIINNATLSSAKGGSAHSGEVTGDYGRITNNGTIIMESGATWTARGYVDGSGLVTVKDGASIYQPMVIQDWRGGTATMGVKDSVFPLNIYALLNVMCRTQYQYGSALYAIVQLKVSLNALDNQTAQILGNSDGKIFQMAAGSQLESWFNPTTRKMEYSVTQGSVNLTYMNINVSGYPMSSQNTVVPFNDMFVINVENGATATITHSVKLLPGAVVNVKDGGTLNVTGNLYIYRGKDYDLTYANSQYYALPDSGGLFLNDARYSSIDGVNGQINVYGTGKVTGNIYCSSVSGDNSAVIHRISGGTFETYATSDVTINEHKGTTKEIATPKFVVPDQNYAVHTADSVSEPNFAKGGYCYIDTVVKPTCEDGGYTVHKCSVCSFSYNDTATEASGHTEVTDAAVAATCTTAGKTEGKHCSACGKVIIAQEKVDALGHTEVADAAVAPTCTTAGKTEGKHCSVCGTVTVAQEEVPANGHTEVIDAAVAATCTETGLTEGKHCSVCGEVIVAQEKVDALGHNEVIDKAVAATCTTAGKTEGKHCDRCGETLVEQTEVPATGHVADVTKWLYDKTSHWHPCVYCNSETIKLDAANHSYNEGKCVCGHELTFTVTWYVDGVAAETDTGVAYGTIPKFNGTATKAEEACTTYTFAGWSTTVDGDALTEPLPGVTQDVSYYAVFTAETTHTIADAWSYDENYHWHGCTACDANIKLDRAEHEFNADGMCVCGYQKRDLKFKIYATNIKAGDSLDMNFYIKKSDVEGLSGCKAIITKTFADGRSFTPIEIKQAEWIDYNSSLYRFGFSDISAKEMTDEVYVIIVDSDNNQISATYYESVESYALRALSMYTGDDVSEKNKKLRTALVDMLYYGAAAQTYFGYGTDDLATDEIDDVYASYATQTTPDVEDIAANATGFSNFECDNLVAQNNITYNFYFSGIKEGMTAHISFEKHTGKETIEKSFPVNSELATTFNGIEVLGIPAEGLAIADGRQPITCVVKDGETVVASAVGSIESYVARNKSNGNGPLVNPLIRFVDSAYAYFHHGETTT